MTGNLHPTSKGAPNPNSSSAPRPRVEEEWHLSRELLENLATQIPGIIFQYRITPDGQRSFPYVSPHILDRYGLNPERLREDSSLLLSVLHREDQDRVITSFRQSGETMQNWRCEFRVVLPDSSVFWHLGQARPDKLSDGSILWNGYISDLTDQKNTEEILWRQANFDALTGLPNRRMFYDRLEEAITEAQRDNISLALLFLDLDNFKDVNDSLGHDMGDALLRQTAKRLRSCVRASDCVARIGGDEFLIMLKDLTDYNSVNRVTQEILRRFAEPFELGNHESHVSASIGITLYPQDADGIDDLLKNADHAMFAAKKKGRNRFNYFTPSMQEKAQNRIALINDLRAALTDYPFMLHYQPIIDLATGAVHKAEALIRWQHPTRGLVSPVEFIPVAEDTGMISDIGNWVCRTAASQVADWRALLHPDFQVSINISPAQFRNEDNALESWIEHLW